MEFTNLTDDTMTDLETFHFAAAKHIQGLPANASNYGSIVTAGWKCTLWYNPITFCLEIITASNELYL